MTAAGREATIDTTTEHLSGYACGLSYQDLPKEVVHQVLRTLVDTLGCAVGGFEGEPSAIARRLAAQVHGPTEARIPGTRETTVPDLAAFTNTVLVRYLDCNDTYQTRGAGHPSDMVPAVLALAGAAKAGGQEVITAIVVAYEAFCKLADQVPLRGWDQGMLAAIGAACGAGKVLGLDRAAMGHAISLAITPGVPLGVTRAGELAMWKGCATAAATRAAVFAVHLAAEGMTGPGQPFEGRDGLWQHLGQEPPSWGPFGGGANPFGISSATVKAYPAVVHAQGPIGLALGLRREVAHEDVAAVQVATHAGVVRRFGVEAEKWDPKTPRDRGP